MIVKPRQTISHLADELYSFVLAFTGRIQFYDQYGVIRDMLQNHLTEIMTLLMMKIPANLSNSEEVLQNKLKVFNGLEYIDRSSVVVGQYQGYNAEVQMELNKTKNHFSLTPTFAGEYITLTRCIQLYFLLVKLILVQILPS